MHPNEVVINDYVDEALGPAERDEVERHLESCAACRAVADDLREIVRVTGSLDLREPPVRAWTRIARAIHFEVSGRSTQQSQGSMTVRVRQVLRSAPYPAWLVAAAVIALAVAATLVLGPFGSPTTTPGGDADASTATSAAGAVSGDAAQTVEAELRQAEQHYEKAIKGLEQIASAEQGALDPGTAATLQKNLAVIDQAINDSRAALRTQPASEPAQQSLLDNFKSKIGLLQDTVSLINEMRKGNEAGAARIVSGLQRQP